MQDDLPSSKCAKMSLTFVIFSIFMVETYIRYIVKFVSCEGAFFSIHLSKTAVLSPVFIVKFL